jgi:vitamin B12 transporter
VRPTDAAEIEVFVLHSKGATDFDGSFGNHENFVQQSAGIAARWSPNRDFRLSARAGESKDEATDDENGVYQSAFNTKRLSATVQADWTVAPHQALNLGADYLHDSVDGNDLFDGPGNVYPVSARRDTAVFAQYNGEFGPQHVVMSARRDDNQQFGGKATGSAAWGYRFADAIRFTATFGSAFKAPTFNELYYPFFGNPNLKPESSHSFELGLDQRRTWGQWSIHAYETQITDLIASDANFTAANIDKTRIRGLEFEVGGKFSAYDWRATATSLDPRNLSERPGQGSTLLRRAKQTALLELGYGYRELRLAGRLNIQGPRFDDLANTQVIGGFTTIDVLVNWRITRQLSLQAKLANVADRHYQTALYYPQDGRNYLLTLRFAR